MTATLQPEAPGRRPLVPGALRRRRAPRFRSRRRFNGWQRVVISILNLTAFLVIWQLVATYGSVPTLYLPAVTDVWSETLEMHEQGILLNNLGISLSIYAIGMVISLAVAITTRCDGCIDAHVRKAKVAGATKAEIAEALGVAIALNAGAAFTYALHALDATEEAGA